ncbi:MAG: hypothetical protein ABF250_09000 [Polaribacter sp.]|uniref:hypothetical protein n=1 Tax=Polaribacter sp. TaxID=1920175 RepID=UPI002613FA64|nr:hypothetical protein [uncultured Polaribacter sp.]
MLLLSSERELSKLKEVLPKNKTDYNYFNKSKFYFLNFVVFFLFLTINPVAFAQVKSSVLNKTKNTTNTLSETSKKTDNYSIIKKNTSKKIAQISNKQKSSISSNTAYLVNGVFFRNEELKAISKDDILSIKVVKRDTVINSKKFDAQILVLLKK